MRFYTSTKMAPAIPIFLAICFIFVCAIVPSHGDSEFQSQFNNATDHASSWKGRSKRSLSNITPLHLKMKIRYTTGEEIELTYRQASQYLANEYLPLITPDIGSSSNVMKDIGEFVLYHDVSKCSAVVYFGKYKTLYGVIGINHYIRDLPYNFDYNGVYQLGVVGEPYVRKHDFPFNHIRPGIVIPPPSDSDAWYNFLSPITENPNRNLKRPLDWGAGPSTKRLRNEQGDQSINKIEANTVKIQKNFIEKCRYYPKDLIFFLETLVFVTRDIADIFEKFFGKDQYIEWIASYLIIYFNAVDMMFQKLKFSRGSIHINIAKIVIESDSTPFTDFMSNEKLQFSNIIEEIPQYLYSHAQEYAEDSFDHIFIYTSRSIFDDVIEVNGLTKHGSDLYEARKNRKFYDVVPITVMRFQYYYADYPLAVHEIGRVFGMKIVPPAKESGVMGQCDGVMQREGPKCDDCLKWSEDSWAQLARFFWSNRNRCFLLNAPRSLRPVGPSSLVKPATQCRCFGYKYAERHLSGAMMQTVKSDGCGKPLQCQDSHGPLATPEDTILPFDGTPCTARKVCWRGKCTFISTMKEQSNMRARNSRY